MKIVDKTILDKSHLNQAAYILTDSIPTGWPTFNDAIKEIKALLAPGNTLLAAVEKDTVLGIGAILAPIYNGNVFELHALAVRSDRRRQGIARAIVTALEDEARRQGGITIYLGADDERDQGETSLANVNLYEDLPEKLKSFSPGSHQTGFYLKLGYRIIGVMPDANGVGKPDIFMAKRL
jgi:aminoglycoside 6'-N-acetyltransferase I